MKKTIALLLCLVLTLSIFAGCAQQAKNQDETQTQTENNVAETSTDPINVSEENPENKTDDELPVVRYGAFLNMLKSSLVYIATEKGFDVDEGVKIELVNVSASADALTSIITEKDEIDLWGMQIMPTTTFIGNGADLVIFGGNAAEGGAMIATKGTAQQYRDDLENLKGKTVLGIRGETGILAMMSRLVDLGFDINEDITIRWADAPSVLEGVAKGEADVGFLPIEWTYFGDDINAEVVYQLGEVLENYICCRMTTSGKILEEKRDELVKVLKAEIRAYKFMKENKEETVKILTEYSGQDKDFVEKNIYDVRISFIPDPYADAIEPFYNVMGIMNFFESEDAKDIDIMDHVDVSLYKDALDEIIAENPNDPVYQELLEIYNRQNSKVK